RLLGLMQVAPEPVSSLDFYDLADIRPVDRDANGNYRWPFGLRVLRAWKFDGDNYLRDFADRRFGRQGVIGITELTSQETSRIMRLSHHEIGVRGALQNPARENGRRVGRSGPPPSTTRTGVMHLRWAEAFTYAMMIEGASKLVFKIGWAFDINLRERQFNRASLPELGGLKYKVVLSQKWRTAKQAFRMEQRLLRQLSELRDAQNSEVVGPLTMHELQSIWGDYVLRARRGQ
ncbi:MAG: hypothetical protein JSR90_20285, partial [Proteobacteria bacterium]|nr:hypothetical protein [Pseudomonadota bacterium]